ncbi:hypothetical protein [Paenibacillus tepidiphilus]|uniref:hypothetical protein n=1 Tax=Paenibacillus tepidiphilus TaxID=2608683 RepID=UPI0012390C30|nr:hypothetical protein [Paenibacillus tepidiphilus]
MRNKKWITLAVVLSLIIMVALYVGYPKNSKELDYFHDEFGLQLPKDTKVLFSQKSYGAMGDGYRLYVYQIPAESMKDSIGKEALTNWFELPLPSDYVATLSQKIGGITDEETASLVPLAANKGYYTIRNNQTNALITGTDVFDFSYNNVLIGILSAEDHKVYLLSYDM